MYRFLLIAGLTLACTGCATYGTPDYGYQPGYASGTYYPSNAPQSYPPQSYAPSYSSPPNSPQYYSPQSYSPGYAYPPYRYNYPSYNSGTTTYFGYSSGAR